MSSPPRGSDPPSPIVLYDGGCALCDRTVRWLLRHDSEGALFYAPLQGDTASDLRARFPDMPKELDTVVLVELDEQAARVSLRSRAVLRVASYLDAPWRHLAWLRYLPPPLTDLAYRVVAALRHRFGRGLGPVESPSAEVRVRFLD